ncbi:MAG: ABC transporter permease [Planctomycetota bacterium]|jgi:phospholipid/cholesterol/gamma-HCH transport system permease protein|nr:ABC transporter permease [Planctomycetota bacterium]
MNFVERTGAKYLTPFFMVSGFGVSVALSVIKRVTHLPRRWRPLLDQMHLSGVKSLHVVLFVNFFIGMILALQLGYELARYGQQEAVGFAVAVAMVREMAPVMTAVVLAASVASAMAAEIGTMKVQEEVTALEVMSVDVSSYLILPRVAALTLVAPILTLLADFVGIVGGGIIAETQLNLDFDGYVINVLNALSDKGFLGLPKSLYSGILKSVIFGFTVAIVGCASGLRATRGASGVGNSTRAAVRNSIILIIVLNFFLGKLIYT